MSRSLFARSIPMLIALLAISVVGMSRGYAADPAQVTATASMSWTLPTTDTLGGQLAGTNALKKVQVFISPNSIPDAGATPTLELGPAATTYQYQGVVPNGSTLYFRVAACNDVCSSLSAQATKAFIVSVPNAPTGLQVTVTVNLNQVAP